jgi:DNA invertase Pin-like site-specific DNA recombinase
MPSSELITPQHLSRRAVIYIRQSSPHQVLTNQESLRLQYALRQRAQQLGWRDEDIQLIDMDLGMTAATAQHRQGFQQLLAAVTLGEVGIILSYEVTRLSRNCSDWYPLLDLCGYRRCLIADHDGVYDPATPNGRILLGLKGQLSEIELFTIRARLTAGLLNKAQRGDLALMLPIGLVRDEANVVHFDPNQEVQHRIALVFAQFLQRRSAAKVLQFFHRQQLALPRRNPQGEVVWKQPTIAAILSILQNPAYAGTFVYGRTRSIRPSGNQQPAVQRRVAMEEWKVRVPDRYPAYISWETFLQIQAMLKDNYAEYDRNQTRGIPRPGKALLHGIVSCGACGHKLVVQYKNGTRYLCNYLRQQYGEPVCQHIPADPVDATVVQAFFEALSPIELDAYERARQAQQKVTEATVHARAQQIERLRYQARLAERQYRQVDPENRLVAAELERRWEMTLRDLEQAEQPTPAPPSEGLLPRLSPELEAAFRAIGQNLPALWEQAVPSTEQKKALLRCLLDKVVIHREPRDQIQVRIVWKGGEVTTMTVPIAVGSLAELSGAAEMEQLIMEWSQAGQLDEEIAEQLRQRGFRSPMGTTLLPSTVKAIRLRHKIWQKRSQSHPRHIPGFLTAPELAMALGTTRHWIYDRIHNGTIGIHRDSKTKLYLFPDAPATRTQLEQLKDGILQQLRFSQEYPDE